MGVHNREVPVTIVRERLLATALTYYIPSRLLVGHAVSIGPMLFSLADLEYSYYLMHV